MILRTLYLKDFRNYKEAVVTFSPGINYIYGQNGEGKTNLLEAIQVLITGRSFRSHHLTDLIRFNRPGFFLEAHFEKHGIEQVLKLSFDGQKRMIIHNASSIASLSLLLGILNGVILSPEDRELIQGGPAARRRFLDLQIVKTHPLYFHHLSRYHRAMKQRNYLIRQKKIRTVEVWEEQMAESAAYLTLQRFEATQQLASHSHPLQRTLSGDVESLKLVYKSSALTSCKDQKSPLKSYFLEQYNKQRPRECEIGTTLTGPHRDDLEILIHDNEARFFASEGQKRCCVTALKLAEWCRLKTLTEEAPIICIDDVELHLDQEREKSLYRELGKLGQIFLTSPHRMASSQKGIHFIHVSNGRLFS
ncbi:MAG: DNA replication/repair protein RecF [Chlamydiales bacterium]